MTVPAHDKFDEYICTTEIVFLSAAEGGDADNDYKTFMIALKNDTNPITHTAGTLSALSFTNSTDLALAELTGGDGYNADETVHRAKWVSGFHNHLFLFNTYEQTAAAVADPPTAAVYINFPYRVRISKLTEFVAAGDWDAAVDGTRIDLLTQSGAILRGGPLRNSMIVYQQRAITRLWPTDVVDAPFREEEVVSGIGLMAPRCLVNTGEAHYFLGNDRQVYEFYGGRDLRPIGDPIRSDMFDNMTTAASGAYLKRNRSWGIHLADIEAVAFAVVQTGDDLPDTFYVYYYRLKKWTKWKFPVYFAGGGLWYEPAGLSYRAIPILGGYLEDGTTRLVYLNYDSEAAYDDDTVTAATAITATVDTKAFIVDLKHRHRVANLWFEAKGKSTSSTISVSISVDNGAFAKTQSVTLTAGWQAYQIDFDITGYEVQFRFTDATVIEGYFLGRIVFDADEKEEVTTEL